jgi:early secretory antigenic target protein ESAT-6
MPNDMIKVNFAEVANASQSLSSTASQLETLLGDLKERLAPLAAGYEGEAAAGWAEKQRLWDSAQDDLRQVLASIGMAVRQSGENYEATEKANAAKWS